MDKVLVYPSKKKLLWQSIEESVEMALENIPSAESKKILKELFDSIHPFENYFSGYEISMSEYSSADQLKVIKVKMETDFNQKSELLVSLVGLSLSNIMQKYDNRALHEPAEK